MMQISKYDLTVRDLVRGYEDRGEGGVVALDERLDIRPPYQREFVYNEPQQRAVMSTVMRGAPLSLIYWAKRHPTPDDTNQAEYEILDGQQRTLSICRFVNQDFAVIDENGRPRFFNGLPKDQQDLILDYPLMVYTCDGDDSDREDWFKTINIAGEKLTNQELRNAVYSGPWLTDAKKRFSRTNGAAANAGEGYVSGSPIRQELLELALKWIAAAQDYENIEAYMAAHQHDSNSLELWNYYRVVVDWAQTNFPKYRKELRSVDWGRLFNEHGKRTDLDPEELESRIRDLMADEDVTKNSGAYEYVLSGQEKVLSIRAFTDRDRRTVYEQQDGVCPHCGGKFELSEMHADHIVPWSKGGHTLVENLQMLCADCNLSKSDK